ncbi:MAG: DUF3224 domain-containing protein [Rhodococcus sp. (in: high G+C Gram-positive bacteria)]|nr:MAG: DUF3224 domain-containing protein [Rhodococcus sp. (in: high G+C Gram-positive bacteria)]
MQTTATFSVSSFEPTDLTGVIETGSPVSVARMVKEFSGRIAGLSTTLFTSAFDAVAEVGTYVAIESFEGTIDGRRGTLNIAHTATTYGGQERRHEVVVIVPGSGTGDLEGITGTGALRVEADGSHHLDLDYDG